MLSNIQLNNWFDGEIVTVTDMKIVTQAMVQMALSTSGGNPMAMGIVPSFNGTTLSTTAGFVNFGETSDTAYINNTGTNLLVCYVPPKINIIPVATDCYIYVKPLISYAGDNRTTTVSAIVYTSTSAVDTGIKLCRLKNGYLINFVTSNLGSLTAINDIYQVGDFKYSMQTNDHACGFGMWLACNGQSFDPNQYPELYAQIGTMFGTTSGTGGGKDTFPLTSANATAVNGGITSYLFTATANNAQLTTATYQANFSVNKITPQIKFNPYLFSIDSGSTTSTLLLTGASGQLANGGKLLLDIASTTSEYTIMSLTETPLAGSIAYKITGGTDTGYTYALNGVHLPTLSNMTIASNVATATSNNASAQSWDYVASNNVTGITPTMKMTLAPITIDPTSTIGNLKLQSNISGLLVNGDKLIYDDGTNLVETDPIVLSQSGFDNYTINLTTTTTTTTTTQYPEIVTYTIGVDTYISTTNWTYNTFSTFKWNGSVYNLIENKATTYNAKSIGTFLYNGERYVTIGTYGTYTLQTFKWNGSGYTIVENKSISCEPRTIITFDFGGVNYLLFCGDGSTNNVIFYKFVTNSLVQISTLAEQADEVVYHYDGAKHYITLSNIPNTKINTYSFDITTGVFTLLQLNYNYAGDGMVVYKMGVDWYMSNGYNNSISTFKFNSSTGWVYLSSVPCGVYIVSVTQFTLNNESYVCGVDSANGNFFIVKWYNNQYNLIDIKMALGSGANSANELVSYYVGNEVFISIPLGNLTMKTYKMSPTLNNYELKYPAYANGNYVVVEGGFLYKSVDGITWAKTNLSGLSNSGSNSLCYYNNKYWFCGAGNKVYSSINLIDWVVASTISGATSLGIATNGSILMLIGGVGTGGSLYSSYDGVTWQNNYSTGKGNNSIIAISYQINKFLWSFGAIDINGGGGGWGHSIDGINILIWSTGGTILNHFVPYSGITYDGTYYWITSSDNVSDGYRWYRTTTPTTGGWSIVLGVADTPKTMLYSQKQNLWLYYQDNQTFYATSTDGTNFTTKTAPFKFTYNSITDLDNFISFNYANNSSNIFKLVNGNITNTQTKTAATYAITSPLLPMNVPSKLYKGGQGLQYSVQASSTPAFSTPTSPTFSRINDDVTKTYATVTGLSGTHVQLKATNYNTGDILTSLEGALITGGGSGSLYTITVLPAMTNVPAWAAKGGQQLQYSVSSNTTPNYNVAPIGGYIRAVDNITATATQISGTSGQYVNIRAANINNTETINYIGAEVQGSANVHYTYEVTGTTRSNTTIGNLPLLPNASGKGLSVYNANHPVGSSYGADSYSVPLVGHTHTAGFIGIPHTHTGSITLDPHTHGIRDPGHSHTFTTGWRGLQGGHGDCFTVDPQQNNNYGRYIGTSSTGISILPTTINGTATIQSATAGGSVTVNPVGTAGATMSVIQPTLYVKNLFIFAK